MLIRSISPALSGASSTRFSRGTCTRFQCKRFSRESCQLTTSRFGFPALEDFGDSPLLHRDGLCIVGVVVCSCVYSTLVCSTWYVFDDLCFSFCWFSCLSSDVLTVLFHGDRRVRGEYRGSFSFGYLEKSVMVVAVTLVLKLVLVTGTDTGVGSTVVLALVLICYDPGSGTNIGTGASIY